MQQSFTLIFPGQGSQKPGMAKPLIENFSYTREFYERASDSIKKDLLKLCKEGSDSELQLTENQQPAILITALSWLEVLKKELGFHFVATAGHSLGEYGALVAAGALDWENAIPLVRFRGHYMQEAVPAGTGAMAAVLGMEDEEVKSACEEVSTFKHIVVPANYNAPGQVVIAGHREAVDAFVVASESGKIKAKKVIALNVSAPFHSPLMKSVAQRFETHLKDIAWKDLKVPVVFNVDAIVREVEPPYVDLMRDQIDHPVLWTQCVKALVEKNFKTFVEIGPSSVLAGLNRRIDKETQTHAIDGLEKLKTFETVWKESQ